MLCRRSNHCLLPFLGLLRTWGSGPGLRAMTWRGVSGWFCLPDLVNRMLLAGLHTSEVYAVMARLKRLQTLIIRDECVLAGAPAVAAVGGRFASQLPLLAAVELLPQPGLARRPRMQHAG